MPLFPLPGPRAIPFILTALVALTSAPPVTAQTDSASDIAPQLIGGERVVEVAAGIRHSCALVENGWVYCWGRNQFGQLGDGSFVDSPTPVRVSGLTGVKQISLAFESTCAVRNTGRVFCWGSNNSGQLGDGTTMNRTTPVRVVALTDVTQVAAGRFHSCALRSSGRVFCWGSNSDGQLGDGTTTDRLTPVRVSGAGVTGATQIVAGALHSCMLRQNGRVTCWGNNSEAQLGDGTISVRTDPVALGITNVTQIAAGDFHNCALRGGGRVFCWGTGFAGAAGNGTTTRQMTPRRVNGLTNVVSIGAAGYHNCVIRNTGRVFCWGRNFHGQLGDGTTTDRLTPVRVVGPRMVNATQVTMGSNHSCGLRLNGRAYCWGWNVFGQLGDGTTTDSPVPVLVRD